MRLQQYIPLLLTTAYGVVYAKHTNALTYVEAKRNHDGAA